MEQQKYFTEAAKRKRADGLSQFQELSYSNDERLRKLAQDPYADHIQLDSLPRRLGSGDEVKFLIAGAGMGGIMTAIKLLKQGFSTKQIRIIDVAGGIGGTWYWNRYPGLHCDCESYIYLPFLEETGYIPQQKYSSGVEIRSYLVALVNQWGLEESMIYRTEVHGLQWDDKSHIWRTDLVGSRGPKGQDKSALWVNAQFVFFTTGIFPQPQVPKLPGLVGFEGTMFHTARWDYEVTGGSSSECFPVLERLMDKRVGIIGTGATAVQVVPEVAKYAKALYVFQRTPSMVNIRGQKKTDPIDWEQSIATHSGWQKARMENFADVLSSATPEKLTNLVNDEWSRSKTYYALVGGPDNKDIRQEHLPEYIDRLLAIDSKATSFLRSRVSTIVKDPETAQKLTPWYPTWCKRPTFSDTYLQTFNQENVHLIDTDGKGVEGVTAKGLVVAGTEYPIDVLILSTGYRSPSHANVDPSIRAGVRVVGRNGALSEKWSFRGASTLHGFASNGFPNFFLFGPSQTGATANFVHSLDAISTHVADIIGKAHDCHRGKGYSRIAIEASEEAEEAWSSKILQGAASLAAVSICTPSYMNSEGELTKKSQEELAKLGRAAGYAAGIMAYVKELEDWRNAGDMKGIEIASV